MNISDKLIDKVLGLDHAAIKSETDKKAYRWLHQVCRALIFSLLIGVPAALYVFFTLYLPELRK